MSCKQTACEVLDKDYLLLRHALIDVAAGFDRIERGEGDASEDPRMDLLKRAVGILAGGDCNRAERLQMLFSDPYEDGWRKNG